MRGKTGKITVMPGFCGEEHSGGSALVLWPPLWMSYLPKIYLGSPASFVISVVSRFLAILLFRTHPQPNDINSILFPSNKNVCNARKNSHQNHTKGWNIWNIKCFTIPYLGS